MNNIPEKDWKLIKSLKEEKLNIACKEILDKVQCQINSNGQGDHEAYLNVWEIINTGNEAVSVMFDDLRRSNAIVKLVSWKRNGLLTGQEVYKFSEETRLSIENIIKCRR